MPSRPVNQPVEQATPKSGQRRFLRVLGLLAVIMVGLLLVSTAANLAIEAAEKSNSVPYGQKVHISSGDINVVRSGDKGPTLVMLTGLGTAAPGLDFAPLMRKLDGYQSIVVEPFGYGYSDLNARPRTIENITEEIHEVLAKLNVDKPYTLVPHSVSGFYAMYYANKYAEEVSAVVGIDPTVPSVEGTSPDAPEMPLADNFWIKLVVNTGLVRWLRLGGEPGGNDFTPAERQQIRQMANWNYGNQAVTDETLRMGGNSRKLQGMSYPSTLPVLYFLAQESIDNQTDWVGKHERQLANVERHELVMLNAQHYLHRTQSQTMADKIKVFLASNDVR